MSLPRKAWAVRTFAYHASYNTLARVAPRVSSALQRITKDTGRGGRGDEREAAAYFEGVAHDYAVIAKASGVAENFFAGKHVLELGPGDTRAMALLLRLEGATKWEGFDAFDLQSRDAPYTSAIYETLLRNRHEIRGARDLLDGCIMHTSTGALEREGRRFDVVLSRAVLEHVRDLRALFEAVSRVVTDDCVLVHKVDLRAHGITHRHALDFLRFSERSWHAMSSHIDLPNRERLSRYLTLAESVGLHTAWVATTHTIATSEVDAVRHALAPRFRAMNDEELSVLGLWLVQVGPKHPLAMRARPALAPAPHALLSRY